MMNDNKYLKMFSTCIVVKGYNRSLILDSQRNNYVAIPNNMQEVISCFNNKKSIRDVFTMYGNENRDTISEYIDFLIKGEYGIMTEECEYDSMVDMLYDFEIASQISNCIVEISEVTILNLEKIISNLDQLNCKNVQFVSYESLSLNSLLHLINYTNNTNFQSIELILKYSQDTLDFVQFIDKNNFRVTELIIHSSLGRKQTFNKVSFDIVFVDNVISNFTNCGVISTKYFQDINKLKIVESLNYNSCLYMKISIDKDGYIKNCPGFKEHYGNIRDYSLIEILRKEEFKKYWSVKKDVTNVCKDCEFRHICTDCRAYVENPDDIYSKPLKCGYNPYTNQWDKWNKNPLKENAIEYYGMQELVKDNA